MANEQGVWSPIQVQGHRSGRSEPIDSVDDSGTERLAVDAKITGSAVLEADLSELNDEVAVYGGVAGSETASAAVRQIINVTDGSEGGDPGKVVTFEASGLVPKVYDFIDLGYDGSNRLTSAVYKRGGSGGTTVATLALTYIGATADIDTVTRT